MTITNQDKPSASVTNVTKASVGETWGTITTTWATETRTWGEVSKLITNIGGVLFRYLLRETGDHILTETGSSRLLLEAGTTITNIDKPI